MKKALFGAAFTFILISQGFFTTSAGAQGYSYPGYGYTYPSYVYPQASQCPRLWSNLTLGSTDYYTGGQVSELQRFLANRYPQLVTGYFGTQTRGNVARFQREQGVYPITGGVGPLTRAAIERVCQGGTAPGPVPTAVYFYLGSPFVLGEKQSAKEYGGQLDVTLVQINQPYSYPYQYNQYGYGYGYYPQPTSARITLGASCPPGLYCAAIWYPQQTYELSVGQSQTFMDYTVTLTGLSATQATLLVQKGATQSSTLSVSSPTSGQVVSRGSTLPVTWSVSSAPANSSIVLDLYQSGGSKVGTMAIYSGAGSNTYNWPVPVPNTVCTMQYPNGLCGMTLSGQYYVKVSLVSGNGFDSNYTTYASAQSGTFTINP